MGRSNRFAEMDEVYVHTGTARKEQPAIRLRHMSGGSDSCRRQPRPRFAGEEGKFITEQRQHKEDQFRAMRDQIEDLTTQLSNLRGHKGSGSGNSCTERRTQGRQHLAQAPTNQRVSRSELKIPKFREYREPKEFLDWVLAVEEVFEFNGVPDEQQVSLVVHTFRGRVAEWWQQLKRDRKWQGKWKINSWEHLLKKMRVAFLPHNYIMERQPQNWRQGPTAVMKKTEKSYKKEVFRETWREAKSPRQVNWTPTYRPQIHKSNSYYVEEEEEFVDEECQESDFIDEEFEPKCIADEDLSQELIDWDTPPVYDDDVNEEEPIAEPLASNLEEEFEEYGLHPIFNGLYPDEDGQLEDEEPTDDIADFEEEYITNDEDTDEDLPGEVPNFDGEDVDYIDFLGSDNILNSPHNDYGEFYVDEENYMFTRESVVDPFLSVFMARGREKERQKNGKSEVLPSGAWGFHDKYRSMPMMKSVAFSMGGFVLVWRMGEWNELTGHPKDRGRDRPNSRANSLQPGEDDADQKRVQNFSVPANDRTPASDRSPN
jgi:hypothetical protein